MTGSGPARIYVEINGSVLALHYTFPLTVNVSCVVLSIIDFIDTQWQPQSRFFGDSVTVHQTEKGDSGTCKTDFSALLNVMESNFYQAGNDIPKSKLSPWTRRAQSEKARHSQPEGITSQGLSFQCSNL